MSDFNFEVFKRRSRPRSSLPTVTLQRRGTFSVNQHTLDALGKPENVELLYDRQRNVMAIRPVSAENQDAYPLRKQSSGATWLIAGTAFCEFYHIPLGTARRYIAEPYGSDGMLLVDLNKPVAEVAGPRAKKEAE
jgi:hypothetical protein